jgi:peptide/nickel transport system substrate-binding protein
MKVHPHISELKEQYKAGEISRREFMRNAALLGLSLTGIASFLSACGPEETAEPTAPPTEPVQPTTAPTAAATATTAAGTPKRGGELVVFENIRRLEDPAATQWTQFNIYRNVAEYLVVINQDNVSVPWLLEKWEPSEDLKTWTLHLRQGIHFNHGPELTADDVVFNIKRWLDPDTGSSTAGLMSYLKPENVKKIDDYTVELTLDTPQIGLPEHLSSYPNVILSKDFGGNWVEEPVGTGPYTLEEYLVEERAVLKARDDYWRDGADGEPLPYMDGIRFIHLGTDIAAEVAALNTGEADIGLISPSAAEELNDSVEVASQVSSYTHVIRMRADKEPFTDINVRNALKACVDREQILQATMRGFGGAKAEDHHVAPIHPAYCEMEIPEQDIEKAKSLLAEAGYEDGLELTLSSIDAEPNSTIAQLFKQQCAPAGITINLEMMPSSLYWEQWMEVDFGITSWSHRPLATMVLGLAYKSGVSWNETHWSNETFDRLLEEASGTLDVNERKEIMCDIQTLMKEEAPVVIPRWAAFLWGHTRRVKNFRGAPQDTTILDEVWLDDAA